MSRIRSEELLMPVSGAILLIWHLPETLIFRIALLAIGLILAMHYLQSYRGILLSKNAWPIWTLFAFFPWILLHAIFFSTESSREFVNLRGSWIRTFESTCIGLGVGLAVMSHSHRIRDKSLDFFRNIQYETYFFIGIVSGFLIYFIRYLYEIYLTGELIHYNFFVHTWGGKPQVVFYTVLLIPFAFIKLLQGNKLNSENHWISIIFLACTLCLFAIFTSSTKSGMFFSIAMPIVLLGQFIFFYEKPKKYKLSIIGAAIAFTITAIIALTYYTKMDNFLNNFMADVSVGLDVENQQYWKNKSIFSKPINRNNEEVNESVYERTALAVVGLQLILENPAGYGLIEHSFGALRLKKWPESWYLDDKTRGATHSGWIDFTLGVGIPGLLLVLIPLLSSFYRSFSSRGFWAVYLIATMPWLILFYLVSEVSVTNFIEQLFFLVAFFCGITLNAPDINSKSLLAN